MNSIKKIAGKILAVWAMLIFIITMLIVLIPIWLTGLWKEPKRSHLMHAVYHIWMRVFLFLTGVRLKIKGKENFKKGETYIIVYNHNSFIDVPASVPFMPGANKTIGKAEMAKIPLFGLIYKRGSVLVDRKSEESRKASYLKMKQTLMMGLHMCIYPEGTRNKTNEPLQRFHDGAFRLAVETNKPIMPAILFNTAKILPTNSFSFMPGKIDLHYLPAVYLNGETTAEFKQKIFDIMLAYYTQHKPQ
jgi:1-acyl-sn-glycerol-3-phosphate acyltransferase